jgi:xylulose-5-phosphate/fructose-6-phosphate phosphoketolase
MACAGDVPTMETIAAVDLIRQHLPMVKLRVVNIVDLMTLQSPSQHPHGLPDAEFDTLFTATKPVIFAFHGYPQLIHRLTYRRSGHDNFHIHGFQEEGTTTTPFDMVVRNRLDRFHLAGAVIDYVPRIGSEAAYFRQFLRNRLTEHHDYIRAHGEDMPEVAEWRWAQKPSGD